MWRDLVVPKGLDEKGVLKWAEEMVVRGVPRGMLCERLLVLDVADYSTEERLACSRAEARIFELMVDRNNTGKQLEASGRLNEAVSLYEQNVADWFIGDFPYRRLRVIYSKQRRYDLAVRVWEKRTEILKVFSEIGKPGDWARVIAEAQTWVQQLSMAMKRDGT